MRRLNSVKRSAFVVPIAALSLVLAACTGGGGSSSDDGDSSTFVYAAAGVPAGLDEWTNYEGDASRNIAYEWAGTLVQYDASDVSEKGCGVLGTSDDVRSNLAESWEYSDDKTQLIFKLRSGVKSPDGNVMTADDVVWSFDRALKQSTVFEFLVTGVVDFDTDKPFEAVDDQTFAVNLNKPTALDVAVFTYHMFTVQDSKRIQQEAGADDPLGGEWLKTHSANFGPWQLEKFTPSSEVIYTSNPNFFDKKSRQGIDRLIIRGVPDASTRLQLLESGQADYAERLSFDQYKRLETSDNGKLVNCASPNRDTLLLNESFEPFSDPDVRKAISSAIDRESLVEGVYKGLASPSTTGISDVYWEPGEDAKKIEFDESKAVSLLADAGVEDLSFAIIASPTRPGAYAQSLAIQMQGMLEKVGVKAEIDIIPGSTEFSDAFFEGKYQAMIYLEPPALGDPFYSANLYNTTKSFQNSFGYNNKEYDEAAEELLITPAGEARDAVIRKVSDIIVDTTPQVYLVDSRFLHAFGPTVSGYENTPHGQLLTYRLKKG